jgi:hypothetical protein
MRLGRVLSFVLAILCGVGVGLAYASMARPPASAPNESKQIPISFAEKDADITMSQRASSASPSRDESVDALTQRLQAEQRNESWAPAAERSLRADLESFGVEGSFKVGSVDCKATVCAAQIRWKSYDLAHLHYRELATHRYALNCVRASYSPAPPAGFTGPYSSRLLLDCIDAQ